MPRINKEIFRNAIKINIMGVNLKRLIKNLYKNDIEIYELNQISHKEIEITIKSKKLKQIKKYLSDYKYSIKNYYGFSFLKNFSLNHLGIVFGIVFFVALNILSANILTNIQVVGNDRIAKNEIINAINSNGISVGNFISNFNADEIEDCLEQKFDNISFVSVYLKGTSLIVNIKEKLYIEEIESSSDIVATENGVITKLSVVQGNTKFKVGDIVKKGDVIIEGRIGDVKCLAIGEVEMKIWYSSSITFYETETIFERTGKSITNSYFKFGNNKFRIKQSNNTFTKSEKEENERYIFNNLLIPLKIYTEKFWELEEKVVKNDFNLQKYDIIEKTKNNAKLLVPNEVEILSEKTEITENENAKIITIYLETIQVIN